MKLWSKEARVLGGMYGVLETPFSFSGVELISDVVFLAFIVCAIMLLFNKTPGFISFVISKHPQTAYYLAAIGWIPYLMIIIGFAMISSYQIFGYTDVVLEHLLFGLAISALLAAVVSLIVAYITARKRIKK